MSEADQSGAKVVTDPKTKETVISVPLSPAVVDAVVLDLRPADVWLEHETKQREKVDIQLGDPEVDGRYHIEAAPSYLMLEALDAPLRAFLVDVHPCRLSITNGVLELSREDLPVPLLDRALAELPRLAEALETLVKTAQVVAVSVDGDPYRGGPPSHAIEKRRKLADLEVKRLRWLQKTPMISATFIATGVAVLAGIGYAFMNFPFAYALLYLVLAIPIWFVSGFTLYLVIAAIGAITGITGIYHRMGNRKFDALEAKAHEPPDP